MNNLSEKKAVLPYAMYIIDNVSMEERGFKDFSAGNNYDAKTQTSTTITMGPTLVLSSFEEKDSDSKNDNEDD